MRRNNGLGLMLSGLLLLACAAVLTFRNGQLQSEAGEEAEALVETLREQLDAREEPETLPVEQTAEPLPVPEEARIMSTYDINGIAYVGILQIPALGLELPIIRDWSYEHLQIAPCLYTGSVYSEDMVLCAHNYTTHFGRLSELKAGDEIIFRTAEDEVFRYRVGDIETLQPTDVDYMTEGEWPLTLFTCTWGGRSRVTVRCEKA